MQYAGSDIRHAPKMYGYTNAGNLIPYYTTILDNQLIDFREMFEKEIHANFLRIEAVDSNFHVSINDDYDSALYIMAGSHEDFEYTDIASFRILSPVGTKIRWYIQIF